MRYLATLLAGPFAVAASAQELLPGKSTVVVPEQSMSNVIAFYAEQARPAVLTLQCGTRFPGFVFDFAEDPHRQADPSVGADDEMFVRLGTADFAAHPFHTSDAYAETNRNAVGWPGQNEFLRLIHAGVPMQAMVSPSGARHSTGEIFRYSYRPNQQDFEVRRWQ